MQIEPLTGGDLGFIAESLRYSKIKFEGYEGYPSWEYKRERIAEAEGVIARFGEFITRLQEESEK